MITLIKHIKLYPNHIKSSYFKNTQKSIQKLTNKSPITKRSLRIYHLSTRLKDNDKEIDADTITKMLLNDEFDGDNLKLSTDAYESNILALYFYREKLYDLALTNFLEALRIVRVQFGNDHPECATVLINLSRTYLKVGNPKESENCIKEAIEIRKKAHGEDHFSLACAYNNYADFFREIKDYQNSILCCKKSLSILDNIELKEGNIKSNSNSPIIQAERASLLNNLGTSLYFTGKVNEAREAWIKSAEIWKTILPTGIKTDNIAHIILAVYRNLIHLSKMENDFLKSERLSLEMIDVLEKYANTTPQYVEAYKYTAQLYERAQDYEKAVEFYKKGRTLAYNISGFGHQFDEINFLLEEAKKKLPSFNGKK